MKMKMKMKGEKEKKVYKVLWSTQVGSDEKSKRWKLGEEVLSFDFINEITEKQRKGENLCDLEEVSGKMIKPFIYEVAF